MELVQRFEELLNVDGILEKAHYATDVDFRDDQIPAKFWLSPSVISLFKVNQLGRTGNRILGLRSSYGYVSDDGFGAVFAAHREDYDLHSVNLLHMWEKIWIVVLPASFDKFDRPIFIVLLPVHAPCADVCSHDGSE